MRCFSFYISRFPPLSSVSVRARRFSPVWDFFPRRGCSDGVEAREKKIEFLTVLENELFPPDHRCRLTVHNRVNSLKTGTFGLGASAAKGDQRFRKEKQRLPLRRTIEYRLPAGGQETRRYGKEADEKMADSATFQTKTDNFRQLVKEGKMESHAYRAAYQNK